MTVMRGHSWGPYIDKECTRFRLWAPDSDEVKLQIAGSAPIEMQPTDAGWREAVTPAPPGTRYRFLVGDTAVPDPASRRQSEGASVVTDPGSYRWRNTAWRGRPWEETVLYELHAGAMGGFQGIIRKLPELSALGITAIQLMPVAHFSGARNWGYDGVLPFSPDESYGAPDDLKHLVDEAHGLDLMVFLDVVYNHFGPEENYLGRYAARFFRKDRHTPWGDGIDYRELAVRRFFLENALYWLHEFRIDGLRFDAVHAMQDADFLRELAREIRAGVPDRPVHLVIENEDNDADLLSDFTAQWNDDFHHAVHVLLTGERDGYYADYADAPAQKLARALRDGFAYQGEHSRNCDRPRGSPSAHLPPAAFVAFLQNHDHIGNRAFGERLTVLANPDALRAAVALLLLCPQIPLIFMGEEAGAREPFLYFCDYADARLAKSVREGRRAEFARFPQFQDEVSRVRIPDPNAVSTFEQSQPRFDGEHADVWRSLYAGLLALRHAHIVPRLRGSHAERAAVIGEKAVLASWRMGDGARLTLACNLGAESVSAALPPGEPLWGARPHRGVPAHTTLCWVETP